MPADSRTFGCTIPEPRISAQPVPSHTGPPDAAHAALHVELRRWLGEREVAGPEARRSVAEEAPREVRERCLQVHEAHTLVDRQPFELGEHGRMRRVEEVAAIHVARNDHADRW